MTVSVLMQHGVDTNSVRQVFGEIVPTEAGFSVINCFLINQMWWRNMQRSGNGAAGRMQKIAGAAPIVHPFVDPTGPVIPAKIIFEDMIMCSVIAGACEGAMGFVEHLTVAVPATLVGMGFKSGVDNVWHTFVNDCPGNVLPVRVRRDTATPYLSSVPHRLKMVVDGHTKTIIWSIDGIEVDRWTPDAALDQMGAAPGPSVAWTMCVPALGNAFLEYHAGGLPQLRIVW